MKGNILYLESKNAIGIVVDERNSGDILIELCDKLKVCATKIGSSFFLGYVDEGGKFDYIKLNFSIIGTI